MRRILVVVLVLCAVVRAEEKLFELVKVPLNAEQLKQKQMNPEEGETHYTCFVRCRMDGQQFEAGPLEVNKTYSAGIDLKSFKQKALDEDGTLFLLEWNTIAQGSGGWIIDGFLIVRKIGKGREGAKLKFVPLLQSYYSGYVRAGWSGCAWTKLDASYQPGAKQLVLAFSAYDRYNSKEPILFGRLVKRGKNSVPPEVYSRCVRWKTSYVLSVTDTELLPLAKVMSLDAEGGPYSPKNIRRYLLGEQVRQMLQNEGVTLDLNGKLQFPLLLQAGRLDQFPLKSMDEVSDLSSPED